MKISTQIYNNLSSLPFSYGEALSVILENQGSPISSLPNEDYVFPDKSILRITNSGLQLLEFLQE